MKSCLPSALRWLLLLCLSQIGMTIAGYPEGRNFISESPEEDGSALNYTRDPSANYTAAGAAGAAVGAAVSRVYSEQNGEATLRCGGGAGGAFAVYAWLKDGAVAAAGRPPLGPGAVAPPGSRYLLEAGGDLAIRNVKAEDDGVWLCQARERETGPVIHSRKIQLTVLDPPKKVYLMIDNRILDPGNPFIPVKENTDLRISCVVDDGNPRPSIAWELVPGGGGGGGGVGGQDSLQDPLDALNATDDRRFGEYGARSDAVLRRVVRAYHNATLTCVVSHMALRRPVNASVLLNVQYSPSFAITREPGFGLPIKEGMAVSLKCDVDANPRAQPVWRKDDVEPPVQQTEDGFLNFTEIQKKHVGWYKCEANHPLGKFSSIGYFLNIRYDLGSTQQPTLDIAELTSTDQKLEIAVGDSVHFSCPAGASGCWSRLRPGQGDLEPLGEASEFHLEKVIYQEAGKYFCIVPQKNESSRFNQLKKAVFIDVTVTGKPIVNPSYKNVTAVFNQPLTLTMEFCAKPTFTDVLWLRTGRVYLPGDGDSEIVAYRVTDSRVFHCYQAVLFITNVKRHHSGEYILIVRSPKGLAEGTFNVSIVNTDLNKYVLNKNSTNTIIINIYVFVSVFSVIYMLILL